MKEEKLIHLIFCIDESGSMYANSADVLGGFQKTIDEQKAVKDGKCIVSLFTFNDTVKERFIGKELDEVKELVYEPQSLTALYDGIGTAIDKIGAWYNQQPEDKRGGEKIFVVITDGEENFSKEYKLKKIKEMIKTQENTYGWKFIYLGNDLSDAKDANDMDFKYRGFTSKNKFYNNYNVISTAATAYRCAATLDEASLAFDSTLSKSISAINAEYEQDTGIKIDDKANGKS